MAGQYLNHTRLLEMIEIVIPISIAAASGFAVLINKLHGHINALERRMDKVELRMATDYVAKEDINYALDKIYADLKRVEDKIERKY